MRSHGRPDVPLDGSVTVRILRMEEPPRISSREKKGNPEIEGQGAVRREQRRVRLPPHPPGAAARRRAVLARAGPPADARARPASLPAPAVPALADRAGR